MRYKSGTLQEYNHNRTFTLSAIEQNYIKALSLALVGESNARIAKEIGCDERSVRRWLNRETVLSVDLRRFQQAIVDQVASKLAVTAFDALDTLRELLRSDDESTRLAAAKTVLDCVTKITLKNLELEGVNPDRDSRTEESLPRLSSERRAELYQLLSEAQLERNGNGERSLEG